MSGLVLTLVLAVALWNDGRSSQATLDWPQPVLVKVVDGLSKPTHVTNAGDGSDRLFVVEKAGRIRIAENGALLATPFLDIASRVLSSGSEQGLFSIAFPPGYPARGHFYVDYTAPGGGPAGHTVVSRFHLASANVADPNSEEVLLTVAQPYANHNGGQLAFGPNDGYLYVGMGDGGSAGDPQNHAQTPGDLLGKILRIDVESSVAPYAVPASNPVIAGARTEVWAYGLRNPWRFSFDRASGDFYVADVGQASYEEVDYAPTGDPGGENYGWHVMEGLHCYSPPGGCDTSGLTMPVVEYAHVSGSCSISGGFVYRGPSYPRMRGVYFYGDYCSGMIWGLKRDGGVWQSTQLIDTGYQVTSFGEDEAGALYVTDFLGGAIYRVTDPSITCSNVAGLAVPTANAYRSLLPIVDANC